MSDELEDLRADEQADAEFVLSYHGIPADEYAAIKRQEAQGWERDGMIESA